MNPEILAQLERIAAACIELLPTPELGTHFAFTRDGCIVLVERRGDAFGAVGSPGMLTADGHFAALVRRGEVDWFVARGEEHPAQPGQAEAARRLFTDLKSVLC